jgi:16S rRNA (cytosine967-C5)-methyltransferase
LYSVCTVSREETSEVIERFLDAHPHYSLDAIDPGELGSAALVGKRGYFSTFPPPVQEPMDGFFAARIRRDR